MCARNCAVSWGGTGSLPAGVRRGWRLEAEAVAAVGGWVSFCFLTSPPKGTRDSLRLQSQPVWYFLAKATFSPTSPSLYLNSQHLNFSGWLQPELGSSRWECPSVDKGLHFPPHTQVFFCSDFLTSTGGVLLPPDPSKYISTLWKSFFHTFLWFLPGAQCLYESCGFTGTRWFAFKWIQTFILILGLHTQKKPVCLYILQILGFFRCFPSDLNFVSLELCAPAGRCMWRAMHSS